MAQLQNMSTNFLMETLTELFTSVKDLNSRVNLITLTIRDKEIESRYIEAREQYYWSTIVLIEILREITVFIAILGGFFRDRDVLPSYAIRVIHYLILIFMYKQSLKRPRVKDFLPIIMILMYGTTVLLQPIIAIIKYDHQKVPFGDFFAITPVAQIIALFLACLVYSTKFWISGYVIIPLSLLF